MYNYREQICEDIRNYIEENEIKVTTSNRDELRDDMYDNLWLIDSITGNASGSYFCSANEAERALLGNRHLLVEAIEEFGGLTQDYKRCLESAETADVTIRCYLLGECLDSVLDELEEEDEEDNEEDEDYGDE